MAGPFSAEDLNQLGIEQARFNARVELLGTPFALKEAFPANPKRFELLWSPAPIGARANRATEFLTGPVALLTEAFVAPTLDMISPAVGTAVTVLTPVTFRLTPNGAPTVLITATLADGIVEVVHDGIAFRGRFANPRCSRTPSGPSFLFQIWRAGGWNAAPTLTAYPVL